MDLKLIVSGRNEGKTTALIAWLLRGYPIAGYPGWSRVIACHSAHEVSRLLKEVRNATRPLATILDERALADLRKAVWSYAELPMKTQGASRDFEYAIDNLDIAMFTDALWRVSKKPAFATITATIFSPQDVIEHD